MKTFQLSIITPEQEVFNEDVLSVVIPAYHGELGILAGHMNLIAKLTTGEIRITNEPNTRLFSIQGGIADIKHTEVKIFTPHAQEINLPT